MIRGLEENLMSWDWIRYFRHSEWEKLSDEGREKLLQKTADRIAAFWGFSADVPKVSLESFDQKGLLGLHTSQGIFLSRGVYGEGGEYRYYTEAPGLKALETVIHEMRHEYQHRLVDGRLQPRNREEELLKERFSDNFQSNSYVESRIEYGVYFLQPVEYDAFSTSQEVVRRIASSPMFQSQREDREASNGYLKEFHLNGYLAREKKIILQTQHPDYGINPNLRLDVWSAFKDEQHEKSEKEEQLPAVLFQNNKLLERHEQAVFAKKYTRWAINQSRAYRAQRQKQQAAKPSERKEQDSVQNEQHVAALFTSFKERASHIPNEQSGRWVGKAGESLCKPSSAEAKAMLAAYGLEGIVYRDAIPDFSPIAVGEVRIGYMTTEREHSSGILYGKDKSQDTLYVHYDAQGNARVSHQAQNGNMQDLHMKYSNPANMKQADILLAETWTRERKDGKSWTASDIYDYRKQNRLSWHELNDGTTMQLVPFVIHRDFPHLGGVSEMKRIREYTSRYVESEIIDDPTIGMTDEEITQYYETKNKEQDAYGATEDFEFEAEVSKEERTELAQMNVYMIRGNGPQDAAVYEQDPKWRQLYSLRNSNQMTPSGQTHKPARAVRFVSADAIRDVNTSDPHFWLDHNNTKDTYLRMAEGIPAVISRLAQGESIDSIRNDPALKDTVQAYFDPQNMVAVEERPEGLSFSDDGRHRIAAARELGYPIPVAVKNVEIKNTQDIEKRLAFERLADYMIRHNYGMLDYRVYSRDPEWQRLRDAAYDEHGNNQYEVFTPQEREKIDLQLSALYVSRQLTARRGQEQVGHNHIQTSSQNNTKTEAIVSDENQQNEELQQENTHDQSETEKLKSRESQAQTDEKEQVQKKTVQQKSDLKQLLEEEIEREAVEGKRQPEYVEQAQTQDEENADQNQTENNQQTQTQDEQNQQNTAQNETENNQQTQTQDEQNQQNTAQNETENNQQTQTQDEQNQQNTVQNQTENNQQTQTQDEQNQQDAAQKQTENNQQTQTQDEQNQQNTAQKQTENNQQSQNQEKQNQQNTAQNQTENNQQTQTQDEQNQQDAAQKQTENHQQTQTQDEQNQQDAAQKQTENNQQRQKQDEQNQQNTAQKQTENNQQTQTQDEQNQQNAGQNQTENNQQSKKQDEQNQQNTAQKQTENNQQSKKQDEQNQQNTAQKQTENNQQSKKQDEQNQQNTVQNQTENQQQTQTQDEQNQQNAVQNQTENNQQSQNQEKQNQQNAVQNQTENNQQSQNQEKQNQQNAAQKQTENHQQNQTQDEQNQQNAAQKQTANNQQTQIQDEQNQQNAAQKQTENNQQVLTQDKQNQQDAVQNQTENKQQNQTQDEQNQQDAVQNQTENKQQNQTQDEQNQQNVVQKRTENKQQAQNQDKQNQQNAVQKQTENNQQSQKQDKQNQQNTAQKQTENQQQSQKQNQQNQQNTAQNKVENNQQSQKQDKQNQQNTAQKQTENQQQSQKQNQQNQQNTAQNKVENNQQSQKQDKQNQQNTAQKQTENQQQSQKQDKQNQQNTAQKQTENHQQSQKQDKQVQKNAAQKQAENNQQSQKQNKQVQLNVDQNQTEDNEQAQTQGKNVEKNNDQSQTKEIEQSQRNDKRVEQGTEHKKAEKNGQEQVQVKNEKLGPTQKEKNEKAISQEENNQKSVGQNKSQGNDKGQREKKPFPNFDYSKLKRSKDEIRSHITNQKQPQQMEGKIEVRVHLEKNSEGIVNAQSATGIKVNGTKIAEKTEQTQIQSTGKLPSKNEMQSSLKNAVTAAPKGKNANETANNVSKAQQQSIQQSITRGRRR